MKLNSEEERVLCTSIEIESIVRKIVDKVKMEQYLRQSQTQFKQSPTNSH